MQYLKKFLFYFFFFLSIASFGQAPSNETSKNESLKTQVLNYINQYKNIAMEEMVRSGIPASITLAQGILESGFGKSVLSLKSNNHFGIKCRNDWKGEKVYHDDDRSQECFRKYLNPEESYKDHSDFLSKSSRYASLFELEKNDYHSWSHGLRKAGYATDPAYATRLINVIESYNLNQYTLQVLSGDFNPEVDSIVAKNNQIQDSNIVSSSSTTGIADSVSKNIAPVYGEYELNKIFVINNLKVLCIDSGTSLLPIAVINDVDLSNLYEYNDLEYNPNHNELIVKKGLIFLEPKRRNNKVYFYLAKGNETMYDIAQKTGIRLNSLLELNDLKAEDIPKAEEKIALLEKTGRRPKINYN
ncbi:MAG: glycoside hydrolase family 73 protein [Chitinophagaceae bacterium]